MFRLQSDRYTLHSHTEYCDGRAPMAEMVAAAVAAGMTDYGFTPHSPIPLDSPCNMAFGDVRPYINEYNRLKAEYDGKINLWLGMEIDYLDGAWGPDEEYFDSLGLDYRIGSVHFLKSKDGFIDVDGSAERFRQSLADHFDNDLAGVVNLFYDTTERMIRAGHFDIIGHFDKIAANASAIDPEITHKDWYKERVNSIIDLISEAGMTAEINTKSLVDRGRFFPDEEYWPRLLELGIPLLVNSDAHYPDRVDANRAVALAKLATK